MNFGAEAARRRGGQGPAPRPAPLGAGSGHPPPAAPGHPPHTPPRSPAGKGPPREEFTSGAHRRRHTGKAGSGGRSPFPRPLRGPRRLFLPAPRHLHIYVRRLTATPPPPPNTPLQPQAEPPPPPQKAAGRAPQPSPAGPRCGPLGESGAAAARAPGEGDRRRLPHRPERTGGLPPGPPSSRRKDGKPERGAPFPGPSRRRYLTSSPALHLGTGRVCEGKKGGGVSRARGRRRQARVEARAAPPPSGRGRGRERERAAPARTRPAVAATAGRAAGGAGCPGLSSVVFLRAAGQIHPGFGFSGTAEKLSGRDW